jgi:hypothetical protein
MNTETTMPPQFAPYYLPGEGKNSDAFYSKLQDFSHVVYTKGISELAAFIIGYRNFLHCSKDETMESNEELVFQILMAGVYGMVYTDRSLQLPGWAGRLMLNLSGLRSQYPKCKPAINRLKGILLTRYFQPFKGEPMRGSLNSAAEFQTLLTYLAASGEFKQESIRLQKLASFTRTLSLRQSKEFFRKIARYARWFQLEGKIVFDDETFGVTKFLYDQHPDYTWREDVLFTGRAEVEYHLNMVGAELMNKAFRSAFLRTKQKVVLVPVCMCEKTGSGCKAIKNGMDLQCTRCSRHCEVNKLMKKGMAEGFQVAIIPHSSDFTKCLEQWQDNPEIGVVGVACVLNLLTGGYETKNLGIASQCVFLDYCGCQNHWDMTGVPTKCNLKQLSRLLTPTGIKQPSDQVLTVRGLTVTMTSGEQILN